MAESQFAIPPPAEFSEVPHVVELGKEAHDPADKANFEEILPPADAPETGAPGRFVYIRVVNNTGHDLFLSRSGHGKDSIWAPGPFGAPPQRIRNGTPGYIQVDSAGRGDGAIGWFVYNFSIRPEDPSPGFWFYQFENPAYGPNVYYSKISNGYTMKQRGGGGHQAFVHLELKKLLKSNEQA